MSTTTPVNSATPDALLTSKVQIQRGMMALAALSYAIYSYVNDDFYIFSKHGNGSHFHGLTANFLECMMLLAAFACVLPLIGLYDKREVKPNYELLRRYSAMAGYGFMAWGIFLNIFHPTLLPNGAIDSWLLRLFGWIGSGLLVAQLGRIPPPYLKLDKNGNVKKGQTSTSAGVAYVAAFLVGLMAGLFYAFTAFVIWHRPDLIIHLSAASLLVWIPLLIALAMSKWCYSIIRRSKPIED